MATNQLKETKGLVIRSFEYGEYDKILHIFTPHEGMMHLIAKGAMRPRNRGSLPTEPLTLAHFYYKEKPHPKLHQCIEVVPINPHLFLRRGIDKLDCACQMALAIGQTQMSHQPAPLLFQLFCYYLKKLEESRNPHAILASFRLKLLRHDGVFCLPACCTVCAEPLGKFWFYGEATYCQKDAPPPAEFFSEEDVLLLVKLTNATNFEEVESIGISEKLMQKITVFFKAHTKNQS